MSAEREQSRGPDLNTLSPVGTSIEGRVNRTARRVQLDIRIPVDLPQTIDVLGEHWIRKNEFHVTIVGPGQELDRRLKELNPSLSNKNSRRQVDLILDDVLKGKSFRVIPRDELRVAEEKDRKTIVRMCEIEGADEFFEELGLQLGFPIEVPPTHITLYTLKNGWPIGICSKERLNEITRKLTNPETHEVGRLIGTVETVSGHSYAWGKIARLMSQDLIKEVFQNSEGDFTVADLCSAAPLFAQILRERDTTDRCYAQAKRVVGELVMALETSPKRIPDALRMKFNGTEEMTVKNRSLRDAIVPKVAPLRKVLTYVIQDLMVNPPYPNTDSSKDLSEVIKTMLETYRNLYEDVFELEDKVGRGRWQIRVPKEAGFTVASKLREILDDDEEKEGEKFITGLSEYLAEKIFPLLRTFRIISLDIREPVLLRADSETSFTDEFRDTKFYRKIDQFKNHMIGDISSLPFLPESVNFFTCFEGWPFDRFALDEAQIREMGAYILISLKPGGKALFFPWQVQGETEEDRKQLENIERLWRSMGANIVRREYTREELKKQMSDRELVLVDHSPVFQEPNDVFTAVILEKPRND